MILRMLEDLCIPFQEYDKVELHEGLVLKNVIAIYDSGWKAKIDKNKKAYLIDEDEGVFIYLATGELWTMILKEDPEYITLAKVANCLGHMGY